MERNLLLDPAVGFGVFFCRRAATRHSVHLPCLGPLALLRSARIARLLCCPADAARSPRSRTPSSICGARGVRLGDGHRVQRELRCREGRHQAARGDAREAPPSTAAEGRHLRFGRSREDVRACPARSGSNRRSSPRPTAARAPRAGANTAAGTRAACPARGSSIGCLTPGRAAAEGARATQARPTVCGHGEGRCSGS
jgi:hypothetical protein